MLTRLFSLPVDVLVLPLSLLATVAIVWLALKLLGPWPRVLPWVVPFSLALLMVILRWGLADLFIPPRALLRGPDAGIVIALRYAFAGALCVLLPRRLVLAPGLQVLAVCCLVTLLAGVAWGFAQVTIEWWCYGLDRVTVVMGERRVSYWLFSLRQECFAAVAVGLHALAATSVIVGMRGRCAHHRGDCSPVPD